MDATISFCDFNSSVQESYPLERVEDKLSGLTVTFVRGRDDRTRQLQRYRLELTPATQAGTWTLGEEKGAVEAVRQFQNGTLNKRIEGVWIESGFRRQMEIKITY